MHVAHNEIARLFRMCGRASLHDLGTEHLHTLTAATGVKHAWLSD